MKKKSSAEKKGNAVIWAYIAIFLGFVAFVIFTAPKPAAKPSNADKDLRDILRQYSDAVIEAIKARNL